MILTHTVNVRSQVCTWVIRITELRLLQFLCFLKIMCILRNMSFDYETQCWKDKEDNLLSLVQLGGVHPPRVGELLLVPSVPSLFPSLSMSLFLLVIIWPASSTDTSNRKRKLLSRFCFKDSLYFQLCVCVQERALDAWSLSYSGYELPDVGADNQTWVPAKAAITLSHRTFSPAHYPGSH